MSQRFAVLPGRGALEPFDGASGVEVDEASSSAGPNVVTAYVVTADGAAVAEDELKQLLRTKLACFEVPREIEFVSDLPHTESGKLTKIDLGRPRR